MERRKEINLDTMVMLKEYNSSMQTSFLAIIIFSIFAIAAFAAIWYRLDAIKVNLGL